MTILITGATGFVMANLVRHLAERVLGGSRVRPAIQLLEFAACLAS